MEMLQELLAREAIKEVKARYCRCLDTKDWQGFAAIFDENAVLDAPEVFAAAPLVGRAAIVESVRNVIQYASSAHHVHSPEITFISPESATVIWAMRDRVVWEVGASFIPGKTAMTGYGHYHESYVRVAGKWLIATVRLTRLRVETEA